MNNLYVCTSREKRILTYIKRWSSYKTIKLLDTSSVASVLLRLIDENKNSTWSAFGTQARFKSDLIGYVAEMKTIEWPCILFLLREKRMKPNHNECCRIPVCTWELKVIQRWNSHYAWPWNLCDKERFLFSWIIFHFYVT